MSAEVTSLVSHQVNEEDEDEGWRPPAMLGIMMVGLVTFLILAIMWATPQFDTGVSEHRKLNQDDFFAPFDYEAAVDPTTTANPEGGSMIPYMEEGMEFAGATRFVWRNVLIASECCARCQNDARCRVWVLDSETHECSLKWVEPNASLKKVPKLNHISGLPFIWSKKSVLCFAVMRPDTYEQGLIAWQYRNKVNIFACDEWAVYSSRKVDVVPGFLQSAVVDSDLKCDMGGEFGTALNTEIFFKVWDQVFLEKRYLFHEFVVKVDPDTVFLVDRLRVAISFHNDEEGGIYFNNCKYGLHGPIEVFSQKAVDVWKGGRQRCVDHFEKLCSGPCLWGEDMFIDQCLQKVLKVKRVNDWNLISEAHCDSPDWPECRNGRVTFHPFKDLVSYEKCLENADAKSWTAGGQLVL